MAKLSWIVPAHLWKKHDRRSYPSQVIAGPAIETEADHFLRCPTCGTWLDYRTLGDLPHHEEWCTHGGNTNPKPGKFIQ